MTRPASHESAPAGEPRRARFPRSAARSRLAGRASSTVVSLVLICGGVLGLLSLAAASAAATVFGFGWGVVVVGAGVLVAGAVWLRQSHPAWLLLPILALVLPSAAITSAHLRFYGHIGDVTVAPAQSGQLARARYGIGLGTLLIDLRSTTWPASGAVTMHVRGDLGRTIIALPANRCIGVRVRYDVGSSLLHDVVDDFTDESDPPVTVFGATPGSGTGTVANADDPRRHPVLTIDFSSQGGPLYVRDYPDSLDPPSYPGWPGFPASVPARPATAGQSAAEAKTALTQWREGASYQRRVNALFPGPCARAARS